MGTLVTWLFRCVGVYLSSESEGTGFMSGFVSYGMPREMLERR